MQAAPTKTSDIVNEVLRNKALRHEVIRKRVLQDARLDILFSEVLGYQIKPFHADLIEFQGNHPDGCLQLAPRGFGKSTALTITRTIFEILRNPNARILLTSKTELQSQHFLREVKAHLATNAFLIECFGEFQSDDKWDTREILVKPRTSTAKESTVTCVGAGGAVASRHYDVIIVDDLVHSSNSWTQAQRAKLQSWFYDTLSPCLEEPDGRMYVNGTRWHHSDLYGHLIKNELRHKHQIIPAIAPDGSTPWPEKFSLEALKEKLRNMGSIGFNAQYQNDTELMKGNMFKDEWFRYYEQEPDWKNLNMFVGCDPAATRKDTSPDQNDSDWWTIVVGGIAKGGSEIYLKTVWRARCSKDEYVKKLREINAAEHLVRCGIENVAAQEYLAQDAEKFMPVERVPRSTDKIARAYWLQAFFENFQIIFPDRSITPDYTVWQALIEELLLFPQADHDDLFDGLQTLVQVCMEYRSLGVGQSVSAQTDKSDGVGFPEDSDDW